MLSGYSTKEMFTDDRAHDVIVRGVHTKMKAASKAELAQRCRERFGPGVLVLAGRRRWRWRQKG